MLTLNQTLYINNVPAKGKFFFYMLYGTGTLHLKVIQIQCVYNVVYIHVTSMPCAYIYIYMPTRTEDCNLCYTK